MRAFLIVLDGVGAGALPDAGDYGDLGSHTLAHVAEANGGLRLPTLESLGLGRVAEIAGVRASLDPRGAFGRMAERSPGKDSTTGHWEMAGIELERPFPTYPHGFPVALLDRFAEQVNRGWIGNVAASGTEIIQSLGEGTKNGQDHRVHFGRQRVPDCCTRKHRSTRGALRDLPRRSSAALR
jgi:phosphopentomutase